MSDEAAPPRELFIARLAIGLLQGLALYLLYRANDGHGWPANVPLVFAPLAMVMLFVPLLVTQTLGSIRLRSLIAWTLAAVAFCALLGCYDRFRASIIVITSPDDILPNFSTFFFGFSALFIAQSLIAASDHDRRVIANYDSYFDSSWKIGVQLALAAVFVGVFWGVLWLGAVLFGLIRLEFVERLIEHDWFAIPATTLATAAAIHLTDVRAKLVAGIRNVVLTMLAWLLPLLTIIAVGFLLSLFVTGLQPLWQTRQATSGMLVACAALVVLINAAYQNGADMRPAVLRYAEAIAAFALVPLVALSVYAVSLRVDQYGWTVDRIASAACLFVAACYAVGYAIGAAVSLRGGVWMQTVQRVNMFTSFAVLALVLAVFSPIADPTRLSVNSQVARLEAGKISPAKFDFDYLHNTGVRFGDAALKRLARSSNADIRAGAQHQLDAQKPSPPPPKNYDMATNFTVYPSGAHLPPEFLKRNWSKVTSNAGIPTCLTIAQQKCEAIMADLDGDGADEIIVINGEEPMWWGTVFKKDASGWDAIAYMPTPHCKGDLKALEAGTYKLAAPPTTWRDITIGDHKVITKYSDADEEPACAVR